MMKPADGDGLILTGDYNNEKTSGLSVAFLGDGTGNAGSVTVAQNSLKFQAGASADEKIVIALNSTHSTVLGRGVDNTSGFENLSQISLKSTQEAIDTIRLVDEALDQLLSMRSQLGSVQKYTLGNKYFSSPQHSRKFDCGRIQHPRYRHGFGNG